jgi:4-amino-4-deoxy-L-arabinose transferase-like glycosyltransferase
MGKKNKIDVEPSEKRGKRGKPQLSFLNVEFGNVDLQTVKRHLLILILASLLTKFFVIFATTSVFHSFIDLFDIGFYFEHAIMLVQGQLPYVSYNFDYPILIFIPIIIALIPALIFQNAMAFVYTFQILMVFCDIVTIICIYFIGLKLWNEKTAFYAGLIFATAFSTAYFVLTKYDAFPTCLLMLAVLFTVYDMNTRGYISSSLGFFAKIFPVIAMPFIVLYNAKTSSLKAEILSAGKIFLLLCVVLILPLAIINPNVIQSYIFATGGSVGIYVNTATYTLYANLNEVLHLGISSSLISLFMYGVMAVVLLLLLYLSYISEERDPKTLLKVLLCAIFALVFFTKFHSPQYLVWFTPLLALLVADDLVKIIVFYVIQIFAYIEFPLMFGKYYVNLNYSNPVGSADWYLTLLFFTLQYLALLLLVYLIIRPPEGLVKKIRVILSKN